MAVNKTMRKKGIRRKLLIMICAATLIVMILGVGLGYLVGFNLLRDVVGDVNRKLSQLLASHITQTFDNEIERIKGYAADPLWREAVTNSNLKTGASGEPAIAALLAEMNNKWVRAENDSPIVKEYTNNPTAMRLKDIDKSDDNIAQTAIFDKSGGLVAASSKTGNFYISDEKWRREFFSDKPGKILIGDVEFEEAPRVWAIPVSVPIKDADGNTIGIFRTELATGRFFSSLGSFRVDNTGHAVLIDGKGNIIYHPGAVQTNVKLASDQDYSRLITSKGKYGIIYDLNIHKKFLFASFFEVTPQVLLDSGKVWRVLIVEEPTEVFKPLNKIVAWLLLGIILLLLVMVAIAFVFSEVLVNPIQKLYAAATEIREGNWDYKINIKTGDEIEAFADAFKEMIANIKEKQAQLMKARGELIEQSKSLEEKVRARTIDLTEAKDKLDAYAKELERALMVKSDFISMASHELRTPLAAIKEGIGIVLDGKTGAVTAQQKEFLDMAKRNVDRLARLINDILDFQKLEYGKMMMRVKENDINEVMREACSMMLPVVADKHLELITSFANDIPKIHFDKDKITQVITNLISNAVKFTEKGSITITTCRDNDVILVSVADTGIGIREEDLPQLFQKFSQIEKGLERRPGGTGLGLIISKEIVEKHKGKIWVESEFGRGTTFHFVLPVKERRAYTKNSGG